ncbi:hypothetical protein AURDEDRAFT_159462 [Auricularia subglabra TFB-10046 SS5]|nr:hypothetical protein AURDEDRAFT_159462 [Auricularia subglabra TFB-10046 SS5]
MRKFFTAIVLAVSAALVIAAPAVDAGLESRQLYCGPNKVPCDQFPGGKRQLFCGPNKVPCDQFPGGKRQLYCGPNKVPCDQFPGSNEDEVAPNTRL